MHQKRPKILTIIPARSGSKGLRDKNIKVMNGKPLMVWSIEQALKSELIDRVIVSTDSDNYAKIAEESGAYVPFLRPSSIANDTATSFEVINHTIEYMKSQGEFYDIILLLEPTSPLRTLDDINNGLLAILNKDFTSVVSMCRVKSSHPEFMFSSNKDKSINPYKTSVALRRQDVEELYYLDGNIYASWIEEYQKKKTFCSPNSTYIVTPELRSFEVDDQSDFDLVELIHSYILKTKSD